MTNTSEGFVLKSVAGSVHSSNLAKLHVAIENLGGHKVFSGVNGADALVASLIASSQIVPVEMTPNEFEKFMRLAELEADTAVMKLQEHYDLSRIGVKRTLIEILRFRFTTVNEIKRNGYPHLSRELADVFFGDPDMLRELVREQYDENEVAEGMMALEVLFDRYAGTFFDFIYEVKMHLFDTNTVKAEMLPSEIHRIGDSVIDKYKDDEELGLYKTHCYRIFTAISESMFLSAKFLFTGKFPNCNTARISDKIHKEQFLSSLGDLVVPEIKEEIYRCLMDAYHTAPSEGRRIESMPYLNVL